MPTSIHHRGDPSRQGTWTEAARRRLGTRSTGRADPMGALGLAAPLADTSRAGSAPPGAVTLQGSVSSHGIGRAGAELTLQAASVPLEVALPAGAIGTAVLLALWASNRRGVAEPRAQARVAMTELSGRMEEIGRALARNPDVRDRARLTPGNPHAYQGSSLVLAKVLALEHRRVETLLDVPRTRLGLAQESVHPRGYAWHALNARLVNHYFPEAHSDAQQLLTREFRIPQRREPVTIEEVLRGITDTYERLCDQWDLEEARALDMVNDVERGFDEVSRVAVARPVPRAGAVIDDPSVLSAFPTLERALPLLERADAQCRRNPIGVARGEEEQVRRDLAEVRALVRTAAVQLGIDPPVFAEQDRRAEPLEVTVVAPDLPDRSELWWDMVLRYDPGGEPAVDAAGGNAPVETVDVGEKPAAATHARPPVDAAARVHQELSQVLPARIDRLSEEIALVREEVAELLNLSDEQPPLAEEPRVAPQAEPGAESDGREQVQAALAATRDPSRLQVMATRLSREALANFPTHEREAMQDILRVGALLNGAYALLGSAREVLVTFTAQRAVLQDQLFILQGLLHAPDVSGEWRQTLDGELAAVEEQLRQATEAYERGNLIQAGEGLSAVRGAIGEVGAQLVEKLEGAGGSATRTRAHELWRESLEARLAELQSRLARPDSPGGRTTLAYLRVASGNLEGLRQVQAEQPAGRNAEALAMTSRWLGQVATEAQQDARLRRDAEVSLERAQRAVAALEAQSGEAPILGLRRLRATLDRLLERQKGQAPDREALFTGAEAVAREARLNLWANDANREQLTQVTTAMGEAASALAAARAWRSASGRTPPIAQAQGSTALRPLYRWLEEGTQRALNDAQARAEELAEAARRLVHAADRRDFR